MPTDADYERMIAEFQDHEVLLAFWRAVDAGDEPDWAPGRALEYVFIRAFKLEGAEARYPYYVRSDGNETLEQIDGAVYADGLACLVECKDRETRVDFTPVARMQSRLIQRPASTIGIVVSTGGFTHPAIMLARYAAPRTILLWGGDELSFALENQCMRQVLRLKYQRYVEHAGQIFWHPEVEELP